MAPPKKSDYVVAIPTYDRVNTLLQDSLPTLLRQGVSPKYIDIFVANNEQKKLYEESIPRSSYNKMIVGVKGLDKQLLFIKDYYPQGKDIIIFHDDIASIFKKVSPQSVKEINLNKFFKYAFKTARKLKLTLWGVNRVSNPFFMTDGYTTDLRLIDGLFYGYINSNNPSYNLRVKNNYTAEDIERAIRHYITDGGILRFNDYGYKTKWVAEGGISSDLGGNEKRFKMVKEASNQLKKLYPEYGEIIPHKDQGVIFRLYKKPN